MSPENSGVSASKQPVLGLCWIVFGIVRLIVAIWMLSFAGTATVMFGAILTRVPNPYSLMAAFHLIYTGWLILSAASGIFAILAGITLLSGAGVARLLGLVAGFVSVGFIPVGTALGAYPMALFARRE